MNTASTGVPSCADRPEEHVTFGSYLAVVWNFPAERGPRNRASHLAKGCPPGAPVPSPHNRFYDAIGLPDDRNVVFARADVLGSCLQCRLRGVQGAVWQCVHLHGKRHRVVFRVQVAVDVEAEQAVRRRIEIDRSTSSLPTR